jgi:ATP-dependent helicase YprA (DUF1998 family)
MLLGRLVDAIRIGPHAEVANVQHPLEAHAERGLEREDVLVETIHGAMDVAGSADDHDAPVVARNASATRLGTNRQGGPLASVP